MQSEVENLNGLSRVIKVTVPKEQVKDEFDKRIQDLAKKANVKGFRKGKVPTSVVKLQYGEAVRQDVIQDLVWESLQQAFKEQNIYPAGPPQIKINDIKEDAPLEYEARFEVFPEVKLELEGIAIELPDTQVEEQNVSSVIEKLRKQNVKWNEVDRGAQEGDLITIDFEGYINDELFEGGSAKDFKLELGSKQMVPGFEEPLYGAKKDDDVLINVTFPEDYPRHGGKPAKFKVKVHKVSSPELPELNDALAVDLGVSDGTVEGLRQEVKQNLERELQRRIRDKVKEQILHKVVERNPIEVPQGLVDAEISRLQKQLQKQWSMQTGQKDLPLLPKEQFQDQARKNVTLGLLLSQWIEKNELKVDGDKVRQRIEEIATSYHQPHEIVNWYLSNKEALSEIENSVIEEQAIDKILELVEVIKKPTSFDEIMNPETQRGDK